LSTGNILADGKVYGNGKLYIANGNISCAGCGCTGTAATTAVNCPGASVSPGLINPHDHMTFQAAPRAISTQSVAERYDHRNDWRSGDAHVYDGHTKPSSGSSATAEQKKWAELRQLLAGPTPMAGSGTAAGRSRH